MQLALAPTKTADTRELQRIFCIERSTLGVGEA
jgi:hypothetical protein